MALDWTQGALAEGLVCYNSARFFEAHEHWESVWLCAEGNEKILLHGVIQVAIALCHHQRGNCKGAIALFAKAQKNFAQCPERYEGIAVARLLDEVEAWSCALAVNEAVMPPVPVVH